VTLSELLDGVEIVGAPDMTADVSRVSRSVEMLNGGTLFAACRYPASGRGRNELRLAAARGATAILVDEHDGRLAEAPACPTIVVRRVNQAYATACANLFGNPQRRLRFYGVTGTKGKTTTCHLIESIFRAAGVRTGLCSTLVQRIGSREIPTELTTPDPSRLYRVLAKMRDAGVTHVVVEVSSIGIVEDRLHGIRFDGVVFTNLGTDHLDYHGSIAGYKAAKRRLFADPAFHNPAGSRSVVNADDAFGRELGADAIGTVVTYGTQNGDVRPSTIEMGDGIRAVVDGVTFESALRGAHNLSNILAAIAVARPEVGPAAAVSGVRALAGLPGHFERVAVPGRGVDVFVDYAHTPESVEAALTAGAPIAHGRRRVVVVGCRGGSDKGKRAPMARTALAHSDVCVITSSNPNVEHPEAIIDDMVADLPVAELVRSGRLAIVVDRREAIFRAIEAAVPDGLVFLLGRGAQPAHAVGHCEIPFDDRDVARAALRSVCA
jgi:UDP-N-acetylmuramoyl-L-alanyl-D-glutamate--2,6-diaminopimelate ligase